MTQPHDEDWRAIVDNFGDTPDADRVAAEVAPLASADPPAWAGDSWADEGRYVPPPPPALPQLTWAQRSAWLSLVGGPALLLVFLFVGYRPPTILTLGIVGAAVGSLIYLIFWSPRTPREPWEDGAQI